MMLFTQVTRCPHCQTSFRVGDEQLDAAGGFVRCGSCLQVFNATEYFVSNTREAHSPADATDASQPEVPETSEPQETPQQRPDPQPMAFTFADDEPEPEPEPEPEQPKAKVFEFEPLSPSRSALHKSAVASQLADLHSDDHGDDDEPDIDLEGSLLISDDGVVFTQEPEATAPETEAPQTLPGDISTEPSDASTEPEDTLYSEVAASPEVSDSVSETSSEDTLEELSFSAMDDDEPEEILLELPEEFSDSGPSPEETASAVSEPLESAPEEISETATVQAVAETESTIDIVSESPSSSESADDDFASLLDDAAAEASGNDEASLDELLEAAEAAADDDDDEELLIHDDMDPESSLDDLLGEEKAPTAPDDVMLENLSDLVSDDYSDILAGTPEEHDDTQFEDKWALQLMESESAVSSDQSEISAPDIDTIEAFEQGEEFSFTDLHEQHRSSGITQDNELAEEPEGYTDSYVDSAYVDEYVDDTESDLPTDLTDAASDEVTYGQQLPDGFENETFKDTPSEADTAFGHLDIDQQPETLSGNLAFNNGVSLDIPAATLDSLALDNSDKPRSYGWVWSIVALLLIITAAAQVGWFRFDQLARNEQLRPAYSALCDVAGCQLPGIQNVALIRATNTVFNPHPTIAEALVIDTLLTNGADYPQPYPDVELEFRDLNDQIVAQRTFSPGEYLAGDVLPGDTMPPQIPVHIALEVINPGPEAVTRQIYVRPNQ